jgi:hypothetical protein
MNFSPAEFHDDDLFIEYIVACHQEDVSTCHKLAMARVLAVR